MAIISANLQFNRGGHGLLDYSSLQKNYSTALLWAQDVNSNAAVGQFIYLEEAETIGDVEYAKGPYVVDAIGEGAVLTPLSKSVAGGEDLAGAVSDLKGEVSILKGGLATTDASVDALETAVAEIPNTYATKEDVSTAIGNVDFSALATKEDVSKGLATKVDLGVYNAKIAQVDASIDEKADASDVYTRVEVDGAIENAIKQIPAAPFQSVAEGDKVLKLDNGVLSSTLSYSREVNEKGEDALVLKGINGAVIGSIPVADFVADGMLESVTPEEGTNNFIFTFKTGNGTTESFKVDFSKYVDTYNADNETLELDSTNNTFKVKDGVFEVAGAADEVNRKLDAYKTLTDASIALLAVKADVDASLLLKANVADVYLKTEADAAISAAVAPLANKADVDASLLLKANVADVYTKGDIDTSINAAISDAVAPLANKADVDASLLLKANDAAVVKGVSLNGVDGIFANNKVALTIDLSGYAEKASVDSSLELKANKDDFDALVDKVGHEATGDASATGLFADIASLRADKADLSALTNGLAAKLDKSATVNGVKFNESGAVVIDAADITLDSAIVRGETEVYAATNSIQTVLANLSSRIDTLDPNISGEFGVSAVDAGDGISITGSASNPTVSVAIDESTVKFADNKVAVKVSGAADNMLTVNENGLYVAKSVPTWESIE